MSISGKRNILIALAVTLALGVPLCLFGRAALLPFLASKTVQVFWADDLRDPDGVGQLVDAAITDEGITLSQLRRLPIDGYDLLGFDSRGTLYIWGSPRFSAYNPAQGTSKDLRFPRQEAVHSFDHDRIIAPGDRMYAIAYNGQDFRHRLFVYDLRTEETRSLGMIRDTQFLIAGTDGRVYGFDKSPWPLFVYDPLSGAVMPLKPPTETEAKVYSSFTLQAPTPVFGQDGFLYGAIYRFPYTIFALNLSSGAILTQEVPAEVTDLIPKPGGGVYLGTREGMWAFDAITGKLTLLPLPPEVAPLSVYALVTRRDGRLVGFGGLSSIPSPRFLFAYTPATGEFERLSTAVESDTRDLIIGPDDRIYAISGGQLSILESGEYAPVGSVQSELIQPTPLALAHTIVGGLSASVEALACGRDGKVYGVKSDPVMKEWLFWYDPQAAESEIGHAAPEVAPEQLGSFLGGTALVALDDGRLVGGTNSGHLFVYTPATGETWDVGQPVSDTRQIAALTLGHDGLVYGGTSSYTRVALFAFDPATGVITDVGLPLPHAQVVGALTVAKDGRVYAGVDSTLVVYDPAARRSTDLGPVEQSTAPCPLQALVTGTDGRIYGGCGPRLFAYDPAGGSVSSLVPLEAPGYVAGLTVGSDGRIYGSMEHEYMNRGGKYRTNQIVAYDPAANRAINLGMAVATGPVTLAACGDGVIYGGSNTTNSNYTGPAYLFAFRTDCPFGLVGAWDKVTWEADTPPGTHVVVDVLDPSGKLLVSNIQSGDSLQVLLAAFHPALILQAHLYTNAARVTPALRSWRADYTFECGGDGTLRESNPQPALPIEPLDWFRRLFRRLLRP